MKNLIISLSLLAIPAINCYSDVLSGPTEPDGYIDGIPYVDLGLPSGTLWAVYNVGAQSEYEAGDYFAWGETEPKDYYDWDNYKYFIRYDPYQTPAIELENIGRCISGTEYDAATVNWGNGWRMPDSIQMREIKFYTTCYSRVENGIEGVRVRGRNSKSIFFGDFGDGNVGPGFGNGAGSYWTGASSTLDGYESKGYPSRWAQSMTIQGGTMVWNDYCSKDSGNCVRAVIKKRSGVASINTDPTDLLFIISNKGIELNRPIADGTALIYDISGTLIHECGITDYAPLPLNLKGIYLITVKETGGASITKKVIL